MNRFDFVDSDCCGLSEEDDRVGDTGRCVCRTPGSTASNKHKGWWPTWNTNETQRVGENQGFLNFRWKILSTRWFNVTFLGWLSDPLEWLGDLQLGDEKVTLNHLVTISSSFLLIIHFSFSFKSHMPGSTLSLGRCYSDQGPLVCMSEKYSWDGRHQWRSRCFNHSDGGYLWSTVKGHVGNSIGFLASYYIFKNTLESSLCGFGIFRFRFAQKKPMVCFFWRSHTLGVWRRPFSWKFDRYYFGVAKAFPAS